MSGGGDITEPTPAGRHHDVTITDTVSIESHVDRHSKHRRQAKTKPYREEWHGDDWNHDRKRYVRRDQVVDRERYRYSKRLSIRSLAKRSATSANR